MLFLIALLGYLAYQIMSPFFTAIAWAIVFSIVFYPVYAFILRHVRVDAVASLITLVLILIVIIGPITYLSSVLINELQHFVNSLDQDKLQSIRNVYEGFRSSALYGKISIYVGESNLPSEGMVMETIRKIGKGLLENISLRIANVLAIIINFLFMLFTTFFLLKDGARFLTKTRDFLPFSEKHKDRLAKQVKDMIVSTVYGGATVALIQGLLGGMIYYFLGLNSPVMWGTAMSIMSFVPVLGTFSIWGPTAAYLIFQGSMLKGMVLFLFGVVVISMVDNILRPLIIGTRTKMPTILILFSVLGGIRLFGMIGFVMGPLIMAVFISVFEIFRHIEDEQDEALQSVGRN
jgi:predicted PurR-regulated permease PerM